MKESSDRQGGDLTGRAIRMALAAGIIAVGLAVFSPFVSPLLWAGVLCYALYPLYSRLVRATGGRRALSALVMCLILTVGVIVPLVYLSLLIAEDVTETYRTVVAALQEGEQPLLEGWRRYPFLAALAEALQNGATMAIFAYLPLIGAGLIWIPAAGYLFWQGAYLKVVVLVVVGAVLAVMDYLVRTIVVGGRSRLHTLLVFFSVLGGLHIFGLVGVVAGPLVVAVGITLVETYRTEAQPVIVPTPER